MKLSHPRRLRILWWGVAALVVGVAVAAVLWLRFAAAPAPVAVEQPAPPPPPHPVSIESNILVLGNTFWGRNTHDWAMASPLKYEYPFSRLHELNRAQYDAWISGLECPVTNAEMTAAQQEYALQFNCRPEFLPEVAKWFTAFTLANNHTDNQGAEGFSETQRRLDEYGVQYFGHYDPRVVEHVCEVVALPVSVRYSDESKTHESLPVALCGYHGVFRIPPDEAIAQIARYAPYMPVFAFPHMGAEYVAQPDEIKTTVYRKLIDAGADVVFGDHPHWVQTTESYKGHLIVYSLGNFMFDQQGSVELTRSAAIQTMLSSVDEPKALSAWLTLGETCRQYKDTCLSDASKLPKLSMTYRFGVTGTDNAGKLVKPATQQQLQAIQDRLRWRATMEQLQAPYGSL